MYYKLWDTAKGWVLPLTVWSSEQQQELPGNLLELQSLRLTPDVPNQDLHFSKILGQYQLANWQGPMQTENAKPLV